MSSVQCPINLRIPKETQEPICQCNKSEHKKKCANVCSKSKMQFCDRNENADDVIQRGSTDNTILRTDIESPEAIENESISDGPSTSMQIPNPQNITNSTENVVNDSSSSDENDNEVRLPTSM